MTQEDIIAALQGDLEHKRLVVKRLGFVGPNLDWYISNTRQADYLHTFYPELIPPPDPAGHPPSLHTLGTIFELNFKRNVAFEAAYIARFYRGELDHPSLVFPFKNHSIQVACYLGNQEHRYHVSVYRYSVDNGDQHYVSHSAKVSYVRAYAPDLPTPPECPDEFTPLEAEARRFDFAFKASPHFVSNYCDRLYSGILDRT